MASRRLSGVLNASDQLGRNALFLLSDVYLVFFAGGTLVAVLRRWRGPKRWLSWPAASAAAVALICIYAVSVPWLRDNAGWMTAVELVLCVACVALCVNTRAAGARHPVANAAVAAGDGSYSTYLTHGFTVGPVAALLGRMHLHPPVEAFAFGMVAVCTAIGILVYLCFEQPLMTRMRRRWCRPVAQPGTSTATASSRAW